MLNTWGITGWFTVNGNHIPIYNGERKIHAFKRFIDGRRAEERMQRNNEFLQIFDKTNDVEKTNQYMVQKFGKNWNKYSKHNIKSFKLYKPNIKHKFKDLPNMQIGDTYKNKQGQTVTIKQGKTGNYVVESKIGKHTTKTPFKTKMDVYVFLYENKFRRINN